MADQPEALRLADLLDECKYVDVYRCKQAAAELRRLAGVEAERDALLSLIVDDGFAASFQTMAQYRSALLKATKGGGNG